ncbi:MAG: dethiobiotin synthase [Fibrobacterota bacterium]
MKLPSFAVAAPDTESGKTMLTAALFFHALKMNCNATVMKPVQTGACLKHSVVSAPDLDTIYSRAKIPAPHLPGPAVPYLFQTPCSPHLAAEEENSVIDISHILSSYTELRRTSDTVLVETAGGVLTPLTPETAMADLIVRLNLPVLLIFNNTLGAISQTLCAIESLRARNIPILGLAATELTPCKHSTDKRIRSDNLSIIERMGECPILGHIGYSNKPDTIHLEYEEEFISILKGISRK